MLHVMLNCCLLGSMQLSLGPKFNFNSVGKDTTIVFFPISTHDKASERYVLTMLFTMLMVHVVLCFLAEAAVSLSWHKCRVPFHAETANMLGFGKHIRLALHPSIMLDTQHLFSHESAKKISVTSDSIIYSII